MRRLAHWLRRISNFTNPEYSGLLDLFLSFCPGFKQSSSYPSTALRINSTGYIFSKERFLTAVTNSCIQIKASTGSFYLNSIKYPSSAEIRLKLTPPILPLRHHRHWQIHFRFGNQIPVYQYLWQCLKECPVFPRAIGQDWPITLRIQYQPYVGQQQNYH